MSVTVTGILRDAAGAALPGTRLTIRPAGIAPTGDGVMLPRAVSATADATGLVAFDLLPGAYRLLWASPAGEVCGAEIAVPEAVSSMPLAALIDAPAPAAAAPRPLTPAMFGAVGDGIADDTGALKAMLEAAAPGIPVDLLGMTFRVTKSNFLPLTDGLEIDARRAKIVIDAATPVADTTGSFLRYANWLFYKASGAPLTKGIRITGLRIEDQRGHVNAVGGVDCTDRDANTAELVLDGCSYRGIGTSAAEADTRAGSLLSIRGYRIRVTACITDDTGYAVFAPMSKSAVVTGNRFSFCGVSRDLAKWSNVAAITTWGSERDEITDNDIHVTGGTSVMAGVESGAVKDLVRIHRNRITAAGLSALSASVRASAVAGNKVRIADVQDNIVTGFLCAPGGTSHSGISFGTGSDAGYLERGISRNNLVDYLAPWEQWDAVNRTVTGSCNALKAVGGDVGNFGGISFAGVSSLRRIGVITGSGDVIVNCQKLGVDMRGIDHADYSFTTINCGWARQANGDPFPAQVLHALAAQAVGNLVVGVKSVDHAAGVNSNNALASWIRLIDVERAVLKAAFMGLTNQQWALRILNAVADCKLTVAEFEPGPMYHVQAGHKMFIDLSAGAETKSAQITWLPVSPPDVITGSRQLLPSASCIIKTDGSARAEVLPWLKQAAGRTIRFVNQAGTSANITVTAQSGETINGAASLTVAPGSAVTVTSTPAGWLTI